MAPSFTALKVEVSRRGEMREAELKKLLTPILCGAAIALSGCGNGQPDDFTVQSSIENLMEVFAGVDGQIGSLDVGSVEFLCRVRVPLESGETIGYAYSAEIYGQAASGAPDTHARAEAQRYAEQFRYIAVRVEDGPEIEGMPPRSPIEIMATSADDVDCSSNRITGRTADALRNPG